ncbi:MAG: Fe-S cluster assembly protein SufD [Bdellovibrionota bacterium]
MNYSETFEKFNSEFPSSIESVRLGRQSALQFFNENGLPTRKNEDWKYTGLKVLTENNFSIPKSGQSISPDVLSMIKSFLRKEMLDVVFFNGEYRPDLSGETATGHSVKSLASGDDKIDFKKAALVRGDIHLQALGEMFSQSEIKIEISENVSLKKPVRLLFLNHLCGGPSLMMHPRVHLKIGKASKATVLESHQGLETARYFVNSRTRVSCSENSNLNYTFHQDQSETSVHMAQTIFDIEKSARLQSLSFQTGSLLSRHNVDVKLQKENSEVDLLGLAVLARRQHCDNKTLIHHEVGQCTTRQIYKSILAGESRYVFSGKIKIARAAQQASSEQLNKNLLISSLAEVDSEPQLEVEADDVKATHGSTIGQLNKEEIFYFKSRGISEEKALDLLSFGFAADVMERIENLELKTLLIAALQKSFKKLSSDAGTKAINLG